MGKVNTIGILHNWADHEGNMVKLIKEGLVLG